MKLNSKNKNIFLFYSLIFILLVNGCESDNSGEDHNIIVEFIELNETVSDQQLNDSIDLFIDYSTCVAKAEIEPEENAPFYHAVRPKLIHYSPAISFWSIKGDSIKKDTGELYTLLRNVTEENYADLKGAVELIVQNNNQAVLITDGEYFRQNTDKDNFNNPYLGQHFVNWLKKGNDIFILSEPYVEMHNNSEYNKYRYYMLFTNYRIENNIYEILKDVINDHSSIKVVHLSISDFNISTEYTGVNKPNVNEVLALNEDTYYSNSNLKFEFQEYQIDWGDIVEYVQNELDPDTGNPIPGGGFILKGIFVNDEDIKYHKIEDIDVKVYNFYDTFRTYEDTAYNNKTDIASEIDEVFVIDKEAFKKDREVILKIHENFEGNGLNSDSYNLLRVDIIIKDVKHTFDNYETDFEIFKWISISPQFDGMENTSVYESIKNVLQDKTLTPKLINNGVLYTIYIKTPYCKL